ncbi:GNAT family N-acetyltransferase [Streptomyces sp. NPDC059680]|uniref:GNAT family N-acetyltransferase n=1 Tax=Streptomyces TaxID=1883 RepID=UPI001E52C2C5|nr:GNAT family N-acetyltransferase [Streptomyces barringtoniae]MCC5477259.1 GNAT family N-acetyltransferase [Streptomyces barringtoniae]
MTGPGGALSVEVCTDEQAFAELAGEWGRLYRAGRSVTPFQSHAWLHSWWLSYGTPGSLRLVLVRADGELVAVAPLMRVHHPWPALVPIGGAISDFCDVLLDESAADRAAPELADALADLARTALVDFREVRPGSAVELVYQAWRGPRRRLSDSECLEIPALPMEQLAKRLPKARAQRVRNKQNKLKKLGVQWRTVDHHGTEAALRRMLDLHRLQWQGRKVNPEHLRPRFSDHLVRSVVPLVRCGEAVVKEFLLEDEVVAVDLTFQSRRLAGKYLYGVHPRLRERKVDAVTMMLVAAVDSFNPEGPAVLSLLRGKEPYKYRWLPETVVNQRFLLARRRTAPLLAAAACAAGAREAGKRLLRRTDAAGSPDHP